MMHIRKTTLIIILSMSLSMTCYASAPEPLSADTAPSYERYITGIGWVNLRVLIASGGGRVAWYRGQEHTRIAFDSEVEPGRSQLFTINPDGSDLRCVTCASPGLQLARDLSPLDHYGEYVGQPVWYPEGGELLLIQVENEHSSHSRLEHMAWGINNDLWMLKQDGSEAQKVYDTPDGQAALHPHFNRFGTQLIFASKLPTSLLTPWRRWHIHQSDVDISRMGQNRLSAHTTLQPAGAGFYETHGFNGPLQGTMTFSFTPDGISGYVQDSYASTVQGDLLTRLTYEPLSWTEHATYSPSGAAFAYNSSKPFYWRPGDGWQLLRTELLMKKGDTTYQITAMNQDRNPLLYQYVVSDFDWDRDGRRLAVQVSVNTRGEYAIPLRTEVWIITFPEAQ